MFFIKIFYKKTQSFIRSVFKKNILNKKIPPSFNSFAFLPVWNFIQKSAKKPSFFIQRNWKFILCLIVAFLVSDLLLIKSYNFLLPDKELPPLSFAHRTSHQNLSPELYKSIWENNIFHTGPIPLQLEEKASFSLDPVLSSLPFKLKGTIVHANPRRSVATITAGSGKKTLSYRQGEPIEKQAEIREIQRGKVIFFNQNNNRLEYILIPEKSEPFKISYAKDRPKSSKSLLVRKTSSNSFQVKRSDINEYLQKLPEILKQARVVPRYGENGKLNGWTFASIDKGSVFEKLGFEKEDVLKEVDGMLPRTPEQALELFDRLKGSSGIKIVVEKDGKDKNYEYNVNENAPIN